MELYGTLKLVGRGSKMHASNGNKIGVFEAIAYCIGDIIGSGGNDKVDKNMLI